MASVHRRPDGRWRARYRDPDGREHARHFGRRVDAERWLDSIRGELARGTYVDPARGKVTFGVYAARWLESQPIRPSSRRTYDIYLRNRLLPTFERRPLAAITPTDVRLLVRRLGDELAPNTTKQIHGVLSAILTAAVDDGYLARNPAAKTAPPKPTRAKVVPLTVDQVQALVEAVPEHYRALVALGAGCGLRLGEGLGLKVGRVGFLTYSLEVVEQLTLVPGQGGPKLGPPKTRASVRSVPLPDMVALALARHLERDPAGAEQLVFRSRTGGPLWPNSFSGGVWRPATRRAGLPGVRFHDLRHFYASALIRAGESVKTVQSALGHSSALETLETYAGLWPDHEERTRAAVDALFPADSVRTNKDAHRL